MFQRKKLKNPRLFPKHILFVKLPSKRNPIIKNINILNLYILLNCFKSKYQPMFYIDFF